MSQSNSQSGTSLPKDLPSAYAKVDRRYRESQYFLADQLRYAESVQDFQSVRQAIRRSGEFSVGQRAFQFSPIAVQKD